MDDKGVAEVEKKKKQNRHSPRNYLLPGGVWRYGRSAMFKRRRNYLKKNLNKERAVKKRVHFKIKPIGGAKNGGIRMILTRKSVRTHYYLIYCIENYCHSVHEIYVNVFDVVFS